MTPPIIDILLIVIVCNHVLYIFNAAKPSSFRILKRLLCQRGHLSQVCASRGFLTIDLTDSCDIPETPQSSYGSLLDLPETPIRKTVCALVTVRNQKPKNPQNLLVYACITYTL